MSLHYLLLERVGKCFLSRLVGGDSAVTYFTVPILHSLVASLSQPVLDLSEYQVGTVVF